MIHSARRTWFERCACCPPASLSRRAFVAGGAAVRGLAAVFSADDLKAIDRDNAVRLMPQLATA